MDHTIFLCLDPSRLGTIPDWLSFLATAATGYVVWRTLKSQLETQKIETNRAAREIRPEFELIRQYDAITLLNEDVSHSVENGVYIKLLNHTAKNVSISVTAIDGHGKDVSKNILAFKFIKPDEINLILSQEINSDNDLPDHLYISNWNVIVDLTYNDEDLRRYEQIFVQTSPQRGEFGTFTAHPPKLLS